MRGIRVVARHRPAGRSPWATTGHLVTAQLVMAACSLLINVMAARTMGPAGRGHLALLLQLAYVANLISLAGTDRSYPATVARQPMVRRAFVDVTRLVLPSTGIVLVLAVPIAYAIGGTGTAGVVTAAGFLMTLAALVCSCALRTGATAAGAGPVYVLATVTGQGTLAVVTAALMVDGVRTPGIWLAGYGAALCVGPLTAWLIVRGQPSATAPGHHLAPARHLGLRLLPAGLASMVMLRADRLLLPWLGTYEQLGLYIIVATVTEFVVWPVQSYVDAALPHWHRAQLSGQLRRGAVLLGASGYGLLVTLALVVAGNLVIVPVFGPAYRESTHLLGPLAIGAALYGISRVAVGLTIASGRPRAVLAADLPAMLTALVSYGTLIPAYGAMGAALGSTVAYGVGALLSIVLCLRNPLPDSSTGRPEQTTTEAIPLAIRSAQ